MSCCRRKGPSPSASPRTADAAAVAHDGVRLLAPAKVNLTLHVVGRREDGRHLLDSIVVFAATGDAVVLRPAPATTLTVSGPFAAAVPAGADNLVLRAARLAGANVGIALSKNLPVGAGIGGPAVAEGDCRKPLKRGRQHCHFRHLILDRLGDDECSHAADEFGEPVTDVAPFRPVEDGLIYPLLEVFKLELVAQHSGTSNDLLRPGSANSKNIQL